MRRPIITFVFSVFLSVNSSAQADKLLSDGFEFPEGMPCTVHLDQNASKQAVRDFIRQYNPSINDIFEYMRASRFIVRNISGYSGRASVVFISSSDILQCLKEAGIDIDKVPDNAEMTLITIDIISDNRGPAEYAVH